MDFPSRYYKSFILTGILFWPAHEILVLLQNTYIWRIFLLVAVGGINKHRQNMTQQNTVFGFSYTINNKWTHSLSMLVSISSKTDF